MKLSFLIPSKNRLALLPFAVQSVLAQNDAEVQIVISDNASDENYAGFVSDLPASKVTYTRMGSPVSVTENWRNALSQATGDYVLMLGDDDALAPWFCDEIRRILVGRAQPDVVYFPSYHYCYPGVMPDLPKGYLARVQNSAFLEGHNEPFELPTHVARGAARDACAFRYRFGFNSQHFLFRKAFLDRLNEYGGVFQSPYPDTFAAVVSFSTADSILAIPKSMVMIGISKQSFGYFYFNDLAERGYDFLANNGVSEDIAKDLSGIILPGDQNNTHWLVAVEAARRALCSELSLDVDYDRYRILQIFDFLKNQFKKGKPCKSSQETFLRTLSRSENVVASAMTAVLSAATVLGRAQFITVLSEIERDLEQFWKADVEMIDIGEHSNILDAFNWLSTRQPTGWNATTLDASRAST